MQAKHKFSQISRQILSDSLDVMPQSTRLRYLHYRKIGRIPNLASPRTFNEHILCRRLRDRDPRMPDLIDKARVKSFVGARLGANWITPSLYEGPALPPLSERKWPRPYVIKATHGSSMNVFVASDADLNWRNIERTFDGWLSKENDRWPYTVWPYTELRRAILCEPRLGGAELPLDYKFFVFNGRVEYIQVDTDRFIGHKRTFFDREWSRQPFGNKFPIDDRDISRPASFKMMIEAAEELGRDFTFLRVDFYEIDGKPRFGELTFFPHSGLAPFTPDEYDFKFGLLWKRAARARGVHV